MPSMPITAQSNFIYTGVQDAESSDVEVPLEAIIDRALTEQRERRSYWDGRSHSKVLDANQHGEYDDKNAKEGTMATMQMLITQGSIESHSFFLQPLFSARNSMCHILKLEAQRCVTCEIHIESRSIHRMYVSDRDSTSSPS